MAKDQPRRRKLVPAGGVASVPSSRASANVSACEAALRTIAHGCLDDLERHASAAADGDAEGLHRLRIAVTRLRTAIRFFAPAVDKASWSSLHKQASWLSRKSGGARDIDVALQRERNKGVKNGATKPWRERRKRLQQRLRRALHSVRYRRFIDALARQSRPSNDRDDKAALSTFSTRRLKRWRAKLLAKSRKLDRLGPRKQHRLRIRVKRFRYAMEWSLPLLKQDDVVLRKQIAQARLIQEALGRLNDADTHHMQAKELGIDPLPSVMRLGRQKSQHRLIKVARHAFGELHGLGRFS